MPGVNRTLRGGRSTIEFMRIDEAGGRITFTALVAGQPPVVFPAKSVADGEVVFENLQHDFPQRVAYRRCGADLCAAIEGALNGKAERMTWTFTRQP